MNADGNLQRAITGATRSTTCRRFFDIITFNHDFGKGWKLDTKTYTYGYSNHQHYQNATDNDLIHRLRC